MFKKYLTPSNLLFVIVLLAFASLRFFLARDFFSFNFDEEYQAHLAYEQVKNFHLIWIGVNASNIGFYLGPGFTYLNALLFKMTNGDLVSLAYFAPLIGVLTGLSLYFVASRLFSKKVGFISMVIYLGSALMNFFDRRFWNPLPIPLITIWLFYFLYKAQKDTRYFIGVAFLLATSLHVHLSLLIFWPVVLFYLVRNIKKIKLKTWLLSAAVYLMVVSPLVVFDVVHNFDNITTPIRYFQNKGDLPKKPVLPTINNHWNVWLGTLSRYLYIAPTTDLQNEQCLGQHCDVTPPHKSLIILSFLPIGYLIYLARNGRKKRYLMVMMLSNVVFLVFYQGYIAEYYLLSFFVLYPITLALFFEKLPNLVTIVAIFVFVISNSLTVLTSTQARYGLTLRKDSITKVMTVIKDRPYALETYGKDTRKYHSYGGWRYLFKIYGSKPTTSFADEFFGWIYQNEITNEKPEYRVVISDDLEYKSEQVPVLSFKEGVYYFYVYKYN